MKRRVLSLFLAITLSLGINLSNLSALAIGLPADYVLVDTIGAMSREQLTSPTGVAISPDGKTYVVDKYHHRVQIFDSNNNYLSTFGGKIGTENNEFYYPYGVAISADGRVLISDCNNQRIQVFDSENNYITTIGTTSSWGSNNNQFKYPCGIDIGADGKIYVADRDNHRIQIFNSDYSYYDTIGTTNVSGDDNDHFNSPYDVAVDPDGLVYVADTNNARIQVFDVNYNYESTINQDLAPGDDDFTLGSPYCVEVDGNDNVYVSDMLNYEWRINVFDATASHTHLDTIDTYLVANDENTKLNEPHDMTLNSDGRLFIASSNNSKIFIVDTVNNNEYVSTIGQNNIFNYPSDVAVDEANKKIYICNEGNEFIDVFDLDNNHLTTIGLQSVDENFIFSDCRSVAVGLDGKLYVADTGRHRIQVFNTDYTFFATLGVTDEDGNDNTHFYYPSGVAIDKNGNVFVADSSNDRIQIFDNNYNYLATIGDASGNDPNYTFNNPIDVDFDTIGNIYVCDMYNDRIQIYDSSYGYVDTIESNIDCTLDTPQGITLDCDGNIYISNTGKNKIDIFNSDNEYVDSICDGTSGNGNYQLNGSKGIDISSNGKIYVADSGNSRIQVFKKGSCPLDNTNISNGGATFTGTVTTGKNITVTLSVPNFRYPLTGETRWIPSTFSINPSGSFTDNGDGTFSASFVLENAGNYTLTVNYDMQVFGINGWEMVEEASFSYSTLPITAQIPTAEPPVGTDTGSNLTTNTDTTNNTTPVPNPKTSSENSLSLLFVSISGALFLTVLSVNKKRKTNQLF